MAIEINNTNRSYLFGRLLAVADVAERSTFDKGQDQRETNAMRYMTTFSNQPEKTWKIIRENLQPYLIKLGRQSVRYTKLIDEITDQFTSDGFNNDRLNGKYLLGLSSQRQALYKKKEDSPENNQINTIQRRETRCQY